VCIIGGVEGRQCRKAQRGLDVAGFDVERIPLVGDWAVVETVDVLEVERAKDHLI
jgi:hypothetical protein